MVIRKKQGHGWSLGVCACLNRQIFGFAKGDKPLQSIVAVVVGWRSSTTTIGCTTTQNIEQGGRCGGRVRLRTLARRRRGRRRAGWGRIRFVLRLARPLIGLRRPSGPLMERNSSGPAGLLRPRTTNGRTNRAAATTPDHTRRGRWPTSRWRRSAPCPPLTPGESLERERGANHINKMLDWFS